MIAYVVCNAIVNRVYRAYAGFQKKAVRSLTCGTGHYGTIVVMPGESHGAWASPRKAVNMDLPFLWNCLWELSTGSENSSQRQLRSRLSHQRQLPPDL